MGKDFLWDREFDEVFDVNWEKSPPHINWFGGGKINVSVNCLDRHVESGRGSAPAITFEADDGCPPPSSTQ